LRANPAWIPIVVFRAMLVICTQAREVGAVNVGGESVLNRVHICVQIMDRLVDFVADRPGTQVLLVPSTRDVHHDPVFPQPAMPGPGLPAAIKQLPNPATFSLNNVVVGVCSQDFLKQVRPPRAAPLPFPLSCLPVALIGHCRLTAAAHGLLLACGLFCHLQKGLRDDRRRSACAILPVRASACSSVLHHRLGEALGRQWFPLERTCRLADTSALRIQVSSQDLAKGPTADRMAALASHIVGQRK
jgi:hypothetical protein